MVTSRGSHADREWQALCYSAYDRHISSLEKRANHAILLLVGISRAVLFLLHTEKGHAMQGGRESQEEQFRHEQEMLRDAKRT